MTNFFCTGQKNSIGENPSIEKPCSVIIIIMIIIIDLILNSIKFIISIWSNAPYDKFKKYQKKLQGMW